MLKNLRLKTLGFIALITGNIIGKKKLIDKSSIKTILVNRTDRLGDAAASLPFLLELQKSFKIKVLTSRYNDPLLKGIVDTEIFTEEPSSVVKSIPSAIKQLFLRKHPSQKKALPQYDLYLDLVGISSVDVSLKIKNSNLCRYYVGFNLGPWNRLLDYAAGGNPVLFAKRHILESYRKLLKDALDIDMDIPESVDLDKHMAKPSDFNIEPPYILVNIAGSGKFRGPTPESYARLIKALDFKGRIIIMDEPGQPNMAGLKTHLNREGLYYLEKKHSIWELAYITKRSVLYIGSDSGITQLLSGLTNCVVFFANGSPVAWKPYSKNEYSLKIHGGIIAEEALAPSGLVKKIIYTKAWCRPCFDAGCSGSACIKRLGNNAVSEEINLTLKKIL